MNYKMHTWKIVQINTDKSDGIHTDYEVFGITKTGDRIIVNIYHYVKDWVPVDPNDNSFVISTDPGRCIHFKVSFEEGKSPLPKSFMDLFDYDLIDYMHPLSFFDHATVRMILIGLGAKI